MAFPKEGTNETNDVGFTLLEVMISLLLLSILITMVFSTVRFMFGQAEGGTAGIENHEMAAGCLNRIASDLRSIMISMPPVFVSGKSREEADPYRFVGSVDWVEGKNFSSLRFVSFAHLPFNGEPESSIAEIAYYVDEDENGQLVLFRSDRLQFDSALEKKVDIPVLCRKMTSFALAFVDAEGETHEEWNSEDSDSRYHTPKAIRILLEIGDGDRSRSYRTTVALPVYRIVEKGEDG